MDGDRDRVVRIYDVSGEEPVAAPEALLLHDSALNTVAFSADSQLLASATSTNKVFIWNVGDWSQTAELNHSAQVTDLAFTQTGDLITFATDGLLRIWSN